MAVHGVSRATADVGLLTLDVAVLGDQAWRELADRGVVLRIARGDADDPLAGCVRLVADDEVVDVVVGRSAWQRELLETAERLSVGPVSLPVVGPTGLILLKLEAGGPKDAWDVTALLEVVDDRQQVESAVEKAVVGLPERARRLWARLRTEE